MHDHLVGGGSVLQPGHAGDHVQGIEQEMRVHLALEYFQPGVFQIFFQRKVPHLFPVQGLLGAQLLGHGVLHLVEGARQPPHLVAAFYRQIRTGKIPLGNAAGSLRQLQQRAHHPTADAGCGLPCCCKGYFPVPVWPASAAVHTRQDNPAGPSHGTSVQCRYPLRAKAAKKRPAPAGSPRSPVKGSMCGHSVPHRCGHNRRAGPQGSVRPQRRRRCKPAHFPRWAAAHSVQKPVFRP